MNQPSPKAPAFTRLIRPPIVLILSLCALGVGLVSFDLLLAAIIISGCVALDGQERKEKRPGRMIVCLIAGWLPLMAIPNGLNLIREHYSRIGFHSPARAQDIGRFLQESPIVDQDYLRYVGIAKVSFIPSADHRSATFNAIVKNHGTKTVLRISAIIRVLDKNNRVIDTKTMIDFVEILPGQDKEISIYTDIPAESKFYQISLSEVQVIY